MEIAGLVARFKGVLGDFRLDAEFSLPGRGVTALVGPSGAGKTTLLRCIAGLERLPGRLTVAGEAWQDARTFLPPHRRAVGYVFQEASLLPHLSVRGNLAYGFRRAPDARAARFDEVVESLGLGPLLDRAPLKLSGGERQRVAIGRALLTQPRLMLMDEPLAGLDAEAKAEILPYLVGLHDSLAIPMLYVSHDPAEVARIADRVLTMRAGQVEPGSPAQADLADSLVKALDRERLEQLAAAALKAGLG
ncbi:molybdenum ABC transporter ATP-binding protein [Phenylobacterium montanum]|uniref:Molybdenum ABC transporter ATP-binding protein n=1 Tax=Phenylobacterium montanum TaxID=2823693 RepID=A0A975IXM9_9CAUL|nr:molybdenum ABC transporter ATP-binding protein [Caulobacter sp. S6]